MKNQKPGLIERIAYYMPLLERYAMRLINDAALAEKIVMEVLENQYEIDGLHPSQNLRLALKDHLCNRCLSLTQPATYYRTLLYLSLSKYLNPQQQNGSIPNPSFN